MSDEQQQQHW